MRRELEAQAEMQLSRKFQAATEQLTRWRLPLAHFWNRLRQREGRTLLCRFEKNACHPIIGSGIDNNLKVEQESFLS